MNFAFMNFTIEEIRKSDARGMRDFDKLLFEAGIRKDKNLEYIAGIYDSDYNLAAAGGYFANTLRCLAASEKHRGDGLMAQIVTHLTDRLVSAGISRLFIYTSCDNADLFGSLGFYEIARASGNAVLLENSKRGFAVFLDKLAAHNRGGKTAALVMNCNPFTLGHRHLIETACARNDTVHLFVVQEDSSLFPFADRLDLVLRGCADLPNVIIHATDSYLVSSAVFPSYFLKDETEAAEAQARLDAAIFTRIAKSLGAQTRYVGEEPFSVVTGIYNRIMLEELPACGINCAVIPRKEFYGSPISASRVRSLLQSGDMQAAKELVPQSTYEYFFSPQGRRVIEKIRNETDVEHY